MTDPAYILAPSERDTLRDMTDDEMRAYYVDDLCPFCNASALDMLHGPMGGLSLNVECARCECRLNVVTGIPRGILWLPIGHVIRNPKPERLS